MPTVKTIEAFAVSIPRDVPYLGPLGPGETVNIDLTLSKDALAAPFAEGEVIFSSRESEATVFYDELAPDASAQDANILRQALAGMIWSQQFFHYDVARWLDGDQFPPPDKRKQGRNRTWRHLKAADVISMPDKWEYPWFAAWDLAFHASYLCFLHCHGISVHGMDGGSDGSYHHLLANSHIGRTTNDLQVLGSTNVHGSEL